MPAGQRTDSGDIKPESVTPRITGETFVNAYAAADAKAIAAHYTPDAEYIDEQGNVFQGREEIQEDISAHFAAHPGAQMEMNMTLAMIDE